MPDLNNFSRKIESKLREIISNLKEIPVENILLDARFKEDLGFDDLHTVEFIMAIESAFSISISDATAEKFKTLNECC